MHRGVSSRRSLSVDANPTKPRDTRAIPCADRMEPRPAMLVHLSRVHSERHPGAGSAPGRNLPDLIPSPCGATIGVPSAAAPRIVVDRGDPSDSRGRIDPSTVPPIAARPGRVDSRRRRFRPVGEHISLTVNGAQRELDVEPRRLLVQALREDLDLTGTHVGCDTSQCGACTVHVDGKAVKSCTMLAVQARGRHGHHDRGHGRRGRRAAPAPGGVLGEARPAVRLLHAGHDHDRGRPAQPQHRPDRGRDPARARGQHLPLYRLPQHRARGAGRGRGHARDARPPPARRRKGGTDR